MTQDRLSLLAERGRAGIMLGLTDMFIATTATFVVPLLLAAQAPEPTQPRSAEQGPEGTAAPALELHFDLAADGALLSREDLQAALSGLGPQDSVLLHIPAEARHGAVQRKWRELSGLSSATFFALESPE